VQVVEVALVASRTCRRLGASPPRAGPSRGRNRIREPPFARRTDSAYGLLFLGTPNSRTRA
jgi:hypothetical protein